MSLTFEDGIWVAKDVGPVSYPSDGNARCFQLEDNSFWFKNRNRLILDLLGKHSDPSKISSLRFMDLGGGNGYVAKAVQDSGMQTFLVEPGEGALNAKVRGVQSIYRCALADLPSEMKFDWIGLFDVVEHIKKPVPFLAEVAQKLPDDGKLIVTVPAYQFLWSHEDVLAGHFRRYTKKTITRHLREAGFEVEFISGFFLPLILPIAIFRVLPFRLGKKAGAQQIDIVETERAHRPNGILRKAADFVFSLERKLIGLINGLPVGASIVVIARKSQR